MNDNQIPNLLTTQQINSMLGKLQQILLTQPITEIYLQLVIEPGDGSVQVVCADAGHTSRRKQVLETFHQYLRKRGNVG